MVAPLPGGAETDPLLTYIRTAATSGAARPIPLLATQFDVSLEGGLAVVATTRKFRNVEAHSIEATITFPVPVHATLFALEARIGKWVLHAQARRKDQARQDYESAIERGKAAVLHEELLRGVHMLSVAHVGPGAEVEVTSTWAMPVTQVDGRGVLRIPLTVGDIYGRSGLPDCDELMHGGPADMAALTVECQDGTVKLVGGELEAGRARVPLNAPIDLEVSGWKPKDLGGCAADGREVILRVEPAPSGAAALNVAFLVDHSGSMGERCVGRSGSLSKHDAVRNGLNGLAERLSAADRIDVWEFDSRVRHIGSSGGSSRAGSDTLALLRQLSWPDGGTEIGSALREVIAQSTAQDVLIITDGKSHALDVHGLARGGRRVSVVLVGEDSLEANIGHLAALTGGEVFIPSGADLDAVLASAVRGLRTPSSMPSALSAVPQETHARRGGMLISARWQKVTGTPAQGVRTRAVAAVAASLVLPALAPEIAGELAQSEGLVTHLTSLVLVDEEGTRQEGIPVTRKVPLPCPRTASYASAPAAMLTPAHYAAPRAARACHAPLSLGNVHFDADVRMMTETFAEKPQSEQGWSLAEIALQIAWDRHARQLQRGDLSELAQSLAEGVRAAAAHPEVALLASRLGLEPIRLAIALIACALPVTSRSALRVVRAILGGPALREAENLARRLRLSK